MAACTPYALLHALTVPLVMSSASLAFPRLILPGMAAVWLLVAWRPPSQLRVFEHRGEQPYEAAWAR